MALIYVLFWFLAVPFFSANTAIASSGMSSNPSLTMPENTISLHFSNIEAAPFYKSWHALAIPIFYSVSRFKGACL
jgi:hypothetical protein